MGDGLLVLSRRSLSCTELPAFLGLMSIANVSDKASAPSGESKPSDFSFSFDTSLSRLEAS